MFIESEPILLDHFIDELKQMVNGKREVAFFEAV
jgi:hypothetical protein